ncbi:hypothetical protein Hanom_Chr06g00481531 [Helianthus anomalus]
MKLARFQTFWIQMQKNKPMDESETGQTSRTKMTFYSYQQNQSEHKPDQQRLRQAPAHEHAIVLHYQTEASKPSTRNVLLKVQANHEYGNYRGVEVGPAQQQPPRAYIYRKTVVI